VPAGGLHVLIVGGGLGGLCLAQGLRRASVSVAVHERDASPVSGQQDHRLDIDARGVRGLRHCLPPGLFDLFVATSGRPGSQVSVVNERLRQLHEMRLPDPVDAERGLPASRRTLREVLLAGLDDVLHFGSEFTRFERLADRTVRAHFADGTSATADILVAADGAGSQVREQLLPQAAPVDTGDCCVCGRTPLTDEVWRLVPAAVRDGFTAVIGPDRQAMTLGLVEFRRRPDRAAPEHWPGLRLSPQADYLTWVLSAPLQRYPAPGAEMEAMDGAALQRVVLDMTREWHPALRGVVEQAEPAETFFLAVRVAIPVGRWETTSVTLLGDAIHAMPPAGGSGANVALLDAGLLSADLVAAALGRRPLLKAIRDYEIRMTGYGFDAVSASRRAAEQLAGQRQGRMLRWLAHHVAGLPEPASS
jgi:2-polyprenyl-6-methoxyphenol hydroxylase-like FAD-dependent oxidoreductase